MLRVYFPGGGKKTILGTFKKEQMREEKKQNSGERSLQKAVVSIVIEKSIRNLLVTEKF